MDIERAVLPLHNLYLFFYITMALKSQKEEVEGLSLNYCTVEKPVAKFIVSYWGIKLTITKGCRTVPPDYVA
jgi:hypothetical protein